MVHIREERKEVSEGVRRVNQSAFGQPVEAELVDALRSGGAVTGPLVAEEKGQIVGHILFSQVTVQGAVDLRAVGLGPMAVLPEHQRRRIGSLLIRQGLEDCRRAWIQAVVVLGHRVYYPCFGFRRAPSRGLGREFDAPDEAFMGIELTPNVLSGRSGVVNYHAAFKGI